LTTAGENTMRIPRRRRPPPVIDMTPMIDCVFQLLIFFMLSSSFQAPMVQLALPQAVTKDADQLTEIVVTVDAKGQYYINRIQVVPERLEEELRPHIAQSKRRVVTFRGDKDMPYQHFVRALDAARAAGAVHLDVLHEGK